MLYGLLRTFQNWLKQMAGFETDKRILDSQFSLIDSLNIDQIEDLTNGYEAFKLQVLNHFHDTNDKLEFLYQLIRLRGKQ